MTHTVSILTEFWIYPVPQLSKIDRKGANVKEGTKDAHRKRVTNSAIHKAAGLTVHGRSEPKHLITHARSCEKNGAGGCEITVPPSAFLYPFFSTQKSRRTERPPGVVLYGGFASFSVPIGWISHVITHSNMASSLEKMEIVGFNNFEESIDMGNITASWPALGSLEKFKPKYIYYSYADLQYRKSLRRQRLMRDRQDPFFALGPNDIRVKFKFYPHTIMDIVGIVAKDLQRTTKRNNPLTPKQTVCVSLYVLGHGRCKNVQLHTFNFNFLAQMQMSKFCIRNFIRRVFSQVKKCLGATFTMFTHHVGKFCLT